MRPDNRTNADRSLESLEARLRAVPQPQVPHGLEARILSAMPAAVWDEPGRVGLCSRRRLAIWAMASVAAAAVCLFALRLWPPVQDPKGLPTVAHGPESRGSGDSVVSGSPTDSRQGIPWFQAHRDLDEPAMPRFAWPVRENPPVMVSAALRPDWLD